MNGHEDGFRRELLHTRSQRKKVFHGVFLERLHYLVFDQAAVDRLTYVSADIAGAHLLSEKRVNIFRDADSYALGIHILSMNYSNTLIRICQDTMCHENGLFLCGGRKYGTIAPCSSPRSP